MHYLGIDIGGTQIKTVVVDEQGDALSRKEILTEDKPGEQALWKEKIARIVENHWQQYAGKDPREMVGAISAPGLVDAENRMTLHMPERLQGIEGYDWTQSLGRQLWALNDGHAACLAEYETFYRSKGIRHLLMLTLGTGVGGGIVLNGELYQGHRQRAGHVGHMTVDYRGTPTMTNMPGSLEHAIGNFSVSERTGGVHDSVRSLVDAYRTGDDQAATWWLQSIEKLAVALASLTNIVAPEVIVLGGGIASGAGDALLDPLKEAMRDCEWRPGGHQVNIVLAQHGSFAGAMGAAYFAKTRNSDLT